MPSTTPIELAVPVPSIVMLGCLANLIPDRSRPVKVRDEAGRVNGLVYDTLRSTPDRPCPVCGGSIDPAHKRHYCGQCDAMAPSNEARIRGARIGLQAMTKAEAAEKDMKDGLASKAKASPLPESERRRIWFGCLGDGLSTRAEVVNRMKVGREWLESIGQEPDFDLILDAHGNIVGRKEVA